MRGGEALSLKPLPPLLTRRGSALKGFSPEGGIRG